MSKIAIADLEVSYCVGVTEPERAKPQRLLVTVEMSCDFSAAAISDRIEKTINYDKLVHDLLEFGEGRSWKLLEKLAVNLADFVLTQYQPNAVFVEVKKFPFSQARHVAVSLTKTRAR